MTSWIPQVRGVGEETFTGNGLRFATSGEALAYANDLQDRWGGCKGGAENRRAFPCDEPVAHAWKHGRLVTIEAFERERQAHLRRVDQELLLRDDINEAIGLSK